MVLWLLVTTMVKHALEGPLAYGAEIIVSDILHGAAFARTVKSLGAVAGTFKNAQIILILFFSRGRHRHLRIKHIPPFGVKIH